MAFRNRDLLISIHAVVQTRLFIACFSDKWCVNDKRLHDKREDMFYFLYGYLPYWGFALASTGGGMTRGHQLIVRGPLRFSRTSYISRIPAVVGTSRTLPPPAFINDHRIKKTVSTFCINFS